MAGLAAYGTTLYIGSVAAGTAIANVTNISGPSLSTETIDLTAHDSANSYREIAPTFISSGEITLDINYDPDETTHGTSAGGLVYLWENKTKQAFSLEFPDATATTKWNFNAYVTGFEPGAPYDDKLSASVTLMIDGAITWAGS
jgi:hypothetical protein